jgi:hypothetical protein
LGNVGLPPPRPMTPPPIPFGQVVTRAGKVVYPPDRYGFGNDATIHDVPPRSPSPTPTLEGLEGSQWANLSVLISKKTFPSGRNGCVRVDALRQSCQRHPGGGLLRARRQYDASRCISPSNRRFTVSSRSVGLLY